MLIYFENTVYKYNNCIILDTITSIIVFSLVPRRRVVRLWGGGL